MGISRTEGNTLHEEIRKLKSDMARQQAEIEQLRNMIESEIEVRLEFLEKDTFGESSSKSKKNGESKSSRGVRFFE